jgi:signal transduction histidine kinase
LEVIGRLETKIAAEMGALRDEVRQAIIILAQRIEESGKRADRLVDRLIEMSMVQAGAFREAASKARSTAALDPASQQAQNTDDDWREEEEWPPKGCDTMRVP